VKKLVVIVNGRGGAGKDTLCEGVSKEYRTTSISSIDPIKRIAQEYGWKGEKDERSRRFLADLKQVFIAYNDLPTIYLLRKYNRFLTNKKDILFVHIREGSEIDKLKKKINIPCITILIRRSRDKGWGNTSDDNVESYAYDYYFDNNQPLPQAKEEFISLIKTCMKQIGRDT
jgi:hypothetical protein